MFRPLLLFIDGIVITLTFGDLPACWRWPDRWRCRADVIPFPMTLPIYWYWWLRWWPCWYSLLTVTVLIDLLLFDGTLVLTCVPTYIVERSHITLSVDVDWWWLWYDITSSWLFAVISPLCVVFYDCVDSHLHALLMVMITYGDWWWRKTLLAWHWRQRCYGDSVTVLVIVDDPNPNPDTLLLMMGGDTVTDIRRRYDITPPTFIYCWRRYSSIDVVIPLLRYLMIYLCWRSIYWWHDSAVTVTVVLLTLLLLWLHYWRYW